MVLWLRRRPPCSKSGDAIKHYRAPKCTHPIAGYARRKADCRNPWVALAQVQACDERAKFHMADFVTGGEQGCPGPDDLDVRVETYLNSLPRFIGFADEPCLRGKI